MMENLDVMRSAQNYNAHIASLLARAVDAAPGRELAIDFGAGLGTFTRCVAPRFRRLLAIEVEGPSIAHLRSSGYEVATDLSSVRDGAADFVLSINVLEHIEDDIEALREIHRVLRRGGRLFLYVPAFMELWSEMDRLVGHHRRYTVESLATRLRAAGFPASEGRYVDSLGAVAAFLLRTGRASGRLNPRAVGLYDRLAFPISRCLDAALSRVLGKNVLLVTQRL